MRIRFALAALAFALLAPAALAQTWLTIPASRTQPGAAANASSGSPQISPNGRWIAFNSGANNVVTGQLDQFDTDVFLLDRQANTMTLVSHAADNPLRASTPGASQAKTNVGLYALFDSNAPFLVPGQTAGFASNTFLHAPFDGSNRLISHAVGDPATRSNGECRGRALDPNAQVAVMACTSTNLQAGITDGNNTHDLYLYQTVFDTNTLITHSSASTTTASDAGVDAFNGRVIIGADRRYVAFTSISTNLVNGVDTNNAEDVFLYDTQDGSIKLVSHRFDDFVDSGPAGASLVAVQNGAVVFNSTNTIHVPGATDTNASSDVFSYDIASGNITLVTHAVGTPLVAANGASTAAVGTSTQRVLIETTATNLANGLSGAMTRDVMLWTRQFDSFTLVSHASTGAGVRANAASRAVASSVLTTRAVFETSATNVIAGFSASPTNASNLYAFDSGTGVNQLITHLQGQSAIGSARAPDTATVKVDDAGNTVAYASLAGDLSASADGNATSDVYAYDWAANASTLISRAAFALPSSGNAQAQPVDISGDGRYVLESSTATDLAFDQIETGTDADVFVYDADAGTQQLVSFAIEGFEVRSNVPANAPSTAKAISRDGTWILFSSAATNLLAFQNDTNAAADVFLANRTGGIALVSHATSGNNVAANAAATPIAVSADGTWVLYESNASNLVTGINDANATTDVFLYDRLNGISTLVSKATGAATAANDTSRAIALTPDGRYALFQSRATNLVAGFTNNNGVGDDVFRFDRTTGTVRLVSHAVGSATQGANAGAGAIGIGDDGDRVVFNSSASNLLAGGGGTGLSNAFLHQVTGGTTRLVSHSFASETDFPNGTSLPVAISGDGTAVLFSATGSTIVNGFVDGNGAAPDLYWYDAATRVNTLFSRSTTSATQGSNREWLAARINTSASRVVFSTLASDVVAGVNAGNFFSQVYQHDRAAGTNSLVSHRDGGTLEAIDNSGSPVMSTNGDQVAYESSSTNLVAWTDNNSARDTFLARRSVGFVVTPVVTGNGTIAPNGPQTVAPGGTATFTLTPGTGQRISSASGCGGTLAGNQFTTAAVNASCTVTIAFVPLQFQLRYLFDPARGTISGATTQTVDYGGSSSPVVPQPNAGFQFSGWSDGRTDIPRIDANVTADVTVTAQFAVQRVNLLYSAGAGGTIDGFPSRFFQVDYGTDGPTVTAIPDAGQAFVRWSDGRLGAQRADLAVTANVNVQAEFAASPNLTVTPVVGANGTITPSGPQTVPPGGITFFDLAPNAGYRIGSAGGCNGSLVGNRFTTGPVNANCTVTFAFNRTPTAQDGTLAAQEDGGSYGGTLVGDDDDAFSYFIVATPTKGQLVLQAGGQYFYSPNADANGTDTFSFRTTDGVQSSNVATVTISIAAINDKPSFALSPAVLPEHPQGTSGQQTRNGILANIDFGPPDEDATQAIASVQAFETFDPANILTNVAISNAGVLTYTLSGNAGLARVSVSITDNGGTLNGGQATSDPQQLTISVRNATDLQVSDTNGATSVAPNQAVVYQVLVANAGPYATTAARLDIPVPAGLSNVLWSCDTVQNATCPQANGTGAINAQSVDLPNGGVLRYLVTGNVSAAAGATLTHVATVATTGAMFEADAANNTATDADPVVALGDALFRNGFENAPQITVPVPDDALLYPQEH